MSARTSTCCDRQRFNTEHDAQTFEVAIQAEGLLAFSTHIATTVR